MLRAASGFFYAQTMPSAVADPADYLLDLYGGEPEHVNSRELRRIVTEADPLAFALTYLWHHLSSEQTGWQVTLSPVHVGWCDDARRWIHPVTRPAQYRDAYIAPRSMGKSTWWFLILPLWAAAHGHTRFTAAFSNSTVQAETHLSTFKHELETNRRLRYDYPQLCRPYRREQGTVAADRISLYRAASGFSFAARGMDSGNLGMKIGADRPDLMILDDIEPGESNYSAMLAEKRLTTLLDDILPLNVFARTVLVGTTVMQDSVLDQLRQTVA